MHLVFVSIKPLCLLIEAFNSFTFKVIIDRYTFIAILLIVLGLFLYLFFVPFFCSLCDLMTIFSVIFRFLSLVCVYIYYRFLGFGAMRFIYSNIYRLYIVIYKLHTYILYTYIAIYIYIVCIYD